jgi:hypothetical protein
MGYKMREVKLKEGEVLHEDGWPIYRLGSCFDCAQCGCRITPSSPHCYCSLNDRDYELDN